MGKVLLLLHERSVELPIDLRDLGQPYRHPDDIDGHIHDFALSITEAIQQFERRPATPESLLQAVSFGDPPAENEMTTLGDYYLPTNDYRRASRGEANLVTGRKGSGKTALWIQLRNEARQDVWNVVVDLKPEGYQLIKLKENLLTFLSAGSREHLITAFGSTF